MRINNSPNRLLLLSITYVVLVALFPGQHAISQDSQPKAASPSRLSSPIRRAIQRGLEADGDIVKELAKLPKSLLSSRRDAEAVIKALETLTPEQLTTRRPENDNISPLVSLAIWFECIYFEENPATETFTEKGIPQLAKCYDAVLQLKQKENEKDLLYLLSLMVGYKSSEATERIVEAARAPLVPHDYTWSTILSAFATEHPDKQKLLRAFLEKLPAEPIAIHLATISNELMAEETSSQHPFDSPAGYEFLRQWLSNNTDVDLQMEVINTIPYLADAEQKKLLEQAAKSPFKQIQLRAASAAVTHDLPFGYEVLKNLCADVGYFDSASEQLRAAGRSDLIPNAATDPLFLAKAKLSRWLQSNTERKDAPSELEILDSRVLSLPPDHQKQQYHLIRFRYADPYGLEADEIYIALVGEKVHCTFDFDLPSRPIEDIYALYTSILAKDADLFEELPNLGRAELSAWLPQWKGEQLSDVVIRSTIQLDQRLKLPNYKIALATAQLNGEAGWVIFDGARSTWYPKSEQPVRESFTFGGTKPEVSMLHVGRLLLGFSLDEKKRLEHLQTTVPPKAPAEVVSAYFRVLDSLPAMRYRRQSELLSLTGPIISSFDDCVKALAKVNESTNEDALVQLYEKLLSTARSLDEPARREALFTSSPLGDNFLPYIKVLMAKNRKQDALDLCNFFKSHWTPYYGYSLLAQAYILANEPGLAEPLLTELFDFRVSKEVYVHEAGLLAEIWKNKGEIAKSQKLLIDCLKILHGRIDATRGLGTDQVEYRQYRDLYQKFLDLYPDGKSKLDSAGLPADPTTKQ